MAGDRPLQSSPIESDEKLLERVTDALRAGPGTLAWQRVLDELGVDASGGTASGSERSAGQSAARRGDPAGVREETELLLRVRERLAMGRSWREISAGEGFTRKLMQRIDQQPQAAGTSVTLWIFAGAMLAVAAVIGWAVVSWLRALPDVGEPPRRGDEARTAPAAVSYGSPRVVWEFGRPWPTQTLLLGALPAEADGEGWRAVRGPLPPPGDGAQAGAADRPPTPAATLAVLTTPLPVAQAAVIEAEFEAPPDVDPHLAVHLVLTPSLEADERLASRPGGGEWVWQWQASGMSVVQPDTSVTLLPTRPAAPRRTVLLQLTDQARRVVVSVDGDVVYRGATGWSSPPTELFAGVRFVARGELRGGVVTAKALRVYEGR
ncbi:MAG: hypothetical protein ACK4PI_09200 [Tepidisphaerales bacterium]